MNLLPGRQRHWQPASLSEGRDVTVTDFESSRLRSSESNPIESLFFAASVK
jgi:hypothetical protein